MQKKRYKDEKFAALIHKFAAEYFSFESNRESLVTITNVEILDRGRRAIIFFTALPIEKEESALEFMRRKRRDFRKFIMDKKSFGFTPSMDFQIDIGEHNRQRVEELLGKEVPEA